MAYKDKFEGEALDTQSGMTFFWNIHEDVGWGCRNRPDDVMLVQFLLRGVFQNYCKHYKVAPPTKKPLAVDGIFGPQTYKWIKAFEDVIPGFSHHDGKVDAIDGTRSMSTIKKRHYTIIGLNLDFSWDYVYFHDLRMDPNLPTLLANSLSQSMWSDPVILN
jgi:hypothetical protein